MLWVLSVALPVNAQWLNDDDFESRMDELRKPRYTEVTMEVSAFTANEGGAIGAWGKTLKLGDCASDDLPQGTVVELPSGRRLTVNDRFGAGYTGKLDVYYGWDLDGALEFGRRTLVVKVLEE